MWRCDHRGREDDTSLQLNRTYFFLSAQYTSSSSSDSSLGNIVTPTGRILSTHSGLWHYTIGQRARIGGMNEKWFVADKRKETGEVVVVPGR